MNLKLVTTARWGTLLRLSSALTLIGLGLMSWSVFDPTPVPVMVALSLGQVIGTIGFAMYLLVVLLDLKRAKVLDSGSSLASRANLPATPSQRSQPPKREGD